MPSGYTSEIYDGKNVSARNFIMNCARAFGALVDMRDEPLSAEIPDEFQPSTYHIEKLKDAQENLEVLSKMSDEKIQAIIDRDYEYNTAYNKKNYDKNLALKARYEHVLEKVKTWQPPTPEHVRLKEFCIEQLEASIEFDCSLDYYSRPIIKLKPDEWRAQRLEMHNHEIEYHTASYEEEVKRAKERTQWVRDLRENLANIESEDK